MVGVIDLASALLYRRYPGARAKKSLSLSLARLTARVRMKVSQNRPRAEPSGTELTMRSIMEKHDIDLGDLLLAACLATMVLGMFFF